MGGKPKIDLGGASPRAVRKLGIERSLITISHCRTHATAYAIAVGGERMREWQRVFRFWISEFGSTENPYSTKY